MAKRAWLALAFAASVVVAQESAPSLPNAKPIPAMQAIPWSDGQVSLQRDGAEIARYHFGALARRPFVFPMIGPSGRMLTRIGHPHDPVGHSHHLSVWASHNDVNGVVFWGDQGKGRIVHQRLERLDDGDEACGFIVLNHWVDENGTPLIVERRQVRAVPLPKKEWLLTVDFEMTAPKQPAVLGKSPFGLAAMRVAKTMGVKDGGGTIRNSEGGVDEAGVFWKPARWCDYSGPVADDLVEGIALFDHPANPNHPTVFHCRNDGWVGSSLTFAGPRTIDVEHPLHLRYGYYVHSGLPTLSQIDAKWQAFAKSELPQTLAPPSKKK